MSRRRLPSFGRGLLNRMVTGGDPRGMPIIAWLAKVPRKPKPLDLLPVPDWVKERISSARQSPERRALRMELRTLIEERRAPGYAGAQDLLWRIGHATDRETGETLPLGRDAGRGGEPDGGRGGGDPGADLDMVSAGVAPGGRGPATCGGGRGAGGWGRCRRSSCRGWCIRGGCWTR